MDFYTHNGCLLHETTPGHPERADRLRAVNARLTERGLLDGCNIRTPQPIAIETIARVHEGSYVDLLQNLDIQSGWQMLDGDTPLSRGSVGAARLAAGAVTEAALNAVSGTSLRAFCAVRPPGHHAERNTGMGFCLFNSVAVAAQASLDAGLERVAILDFDVHHGNGTVDAFRDNPNVLVCSSFQHPFYPNRMTTIPGEHLVYTPLPEGTGSSAFRASIERDWLPALARHQPQLVLVSAGFDAHRDDPLAGLQLVEADYTWITELALQAAHDYAGGRLVSTLEGGYDLEALAESVCAHVEVLQQT